MIFPVVIYGFESWITENMEKWEFSYIPREQEQIHLKDSLVSFTTDKDMHICYGLQHTRLPCPSPTPGACSNSCTSISDANQPSYPLLSPPPAFNLSQHQGKIPMSQFFASGGQSIGVSASTSILPMNTQDWFPLEWSGWISLLSKGLSRVFSRTTVQKHQFFGIQPSS